MAYANDAHGPQGFWTRYVWSQDHKVIAVQYTLVAIVVGLVGVAPRGYVQNAVSGALLHAQHVALQ